MATIPERRSGPDRRHKPRGGRRPSDLSGFTPLVLVVDDDAHAREVCEAILAKLHFAVTSAASVDKAIEVMTALQPEMIVARTRDVDALRALASDTEVGAVPVVAIGDAGPDASVLIDDIRRALRAARAARA